jgi:hypothetical protein
VKTDELLHQIDFKDVEVLNLFTNKLADFIEHEAGKELYEDAIRAAALEQINKLKLPRWARWLKGPIMRKIIGWMMEYGSELLSGILRGVAKR